MLLAANKHPHFEIVIAADAPPAVRHAADELQRYTDRIALAFPRIRADAEGDPGEPPARAALIGESAARRELVPDADLASLAGESYVIQTRGPHLLVAGGSPRGTLYGVYDLLERLGVRWWTPGEETAPVRRTLELPGLNIRVDPPLIYRATWFRHAMDGDFQARRRLSAGTMGPMHLRERHGGMVRFAADASGHTYEGLVPTHTYFDAHPEYFSEVKGQRLRHMNQLCPTHPAVAEIAAETARRWLDATPGCNLVSVTQNDWANWCTCPTCRPLLERTGAPSGPMLHLANEVARHLEKTHPHALVDTFAYAWSEVAPRNIEAHPQVLIRIAPIGNCFGHSIAGDCPANERCRTSVKSWSKIARHLFIWHYVTDFFHYLPPFPNLPPLEDDVRFYLEHGVKGIFMQGNGTSLGGDMPELKAYLISKLLFDPRHTSAADVREEFITGYYRGAAPAVREYLGVFEKSFAEAGPSAHLHLYRSLWRNEASYLEPAVLKRARAALARGRKRADGHDVAERLERLRASLDYAELFYHERPHARKLSPRGDQVKCRASRHRQRLAKRFFDTLERHRVTHYAEDLGRYTTLGMLRRAWLDSAGKHEAIALAGGDSRAVVVPEIGGRIVAFGPDADGGVAVNYLGESSTGTFGYPCAGGYEEYALRPHQSPGFCERYEVTRRGESGLELRAELETGATIVRRIELDGATGELAVHTRMLNERDAALPGCLRAHLEIDLATPPGELETYFLRGGKWERIEFGNDAGGKPAAPGAPGGTWYDADVPDGWLFWSAARSRGLWQRWSREGVGALFLGTIPAEPTALALDLARGRYNEPIAPGGEQSMSHRFRWVTEKPAGVAR